jgi:hypothetical protein
MARLLQTPRDVRAAMNYSTTISRRRRAKKVEYLARLVYRDSTTGLRKERSKSASSCSEGDCQLNFMKKQNYQLRQDESTSCDLVG